MRTKPGSGYVSHGKHTALRSRVSSTTWWRDGGVVSFFLLSISFPSCSSFLSFHAFFLFFFPLLLFLISLSLALALALSCSRSRSRSLFSFILLSFLIDCFFLDGLDGHLTTAGLGRGASNVRNWRETREGGIAEGGAIFGRSDIYMGFNAERGRGRPMEG